RDADDLAFELLDRFYFRSGHKVELRLRIDDQDKSHRRASNSGRNDRSSGRCVINRAADQSLHPDRSSYKQGFEIESFFAIKALRWAILNCSSVTAMEVVENRIFLSCARADDEARIRKNSVVIPTTTLVILGVVLSSSVWTESCC